MATVTTSTASYATKGGRHTGRTSAGVDWVMVYDLANTRFTFWFSSDDGATWAERTGFRKTVAANRADWAEFYIGEHDRAVFASCGSGGWQVTFTPHIPTATVWWSELQSNTSQDTDQIRCRVLDYSATQFAIVALEINSGGEGDWWTWQRKVSDFSAVSEQRVTFATGCDQADFDFQHNGDGKTAVTNPALYLLWRDIDANRTYMERRAWNNTQRGWSITKSPRVVSTSAAAEADPMACVFDGHRFVMSFFNNDTTGGFPRWVERDAADTVTTQRTVPDMADGEQTSLSLTRDSAGNTRLYAVGATSQDVRRITFDRVAGTFGSWELVEASTAVAQTMSVQAGFHFDGIGVVWTSGGSSPYTVTYDRDPYNVAPLAPSWVSPSLNTAISTSGSTVLTWQFNDPGDTQSAYLLERTVTGGSLDGQVQGWTGSLWSSPVFEPSHKRMTSTQTVSVTPASVASGAASLGFRVKTWDSSDEPSPFSAVLTLKPSTPVIPVITVPADAATITSSSLGIVEWTATEQTAFRGRLLTSADAVLEDSGKVTTGVKEWQPSTVLTTGMTGVKVEIRVWNDDDLEGSTDLHTVSVTFVPPATPTLVVAADDANGRISVTVTNPAPTGDQPTVTSHDLFVRVVSGGRSVGERSTDLAGIRIIAADPATVLYDYAAASGFNFEYMVRANAASNGTSADSAWTA